jgi:hypothetical protein
LDAVDAASRLVGHLGTLGRHLQAIATRAHVTGQLLTPTRGLPEAELALLPWHRRYAPLPDSAFPPIARAYAVAEHASVDAASALGVASSALRMSVHVAQAHRSVSLNQAGSAGRRVAGAGPGEVGDGPMRRGPDLSL